MATFYVLPPRDVLEREAGALLARALPGLPPPSGLWDALLETALAAHPDVFAVHREDLAGDPAEELADAFGAEPGDAVVEVVGGRPRRAVVPEPAAAR